MRISLLYGIQHTNATKKQQSEFLLTEVGVSSREKTVE